MKLESVVLASAILGLIVFGEACGSLNPQPPPATVFRVVTKSFINGLLQNEGGVGYEGNTANPGQWPGRTSVGPTNTNSSGYNDETNVAVPNQWTFTRYPSPFCNKFVTKTSLGQITSNAFVNLPCDTSTVFFTANPSDMDMYSYPSTFSVTNGSGLSTQYGMPLLQLYDSSGSVYFTFSASSVASDGSWLQAYTPQLEQLGTGEYDILISNAQSDGSYARLGATSVNVTYTDPGGDGGHCPPYPLECGP